MESFRSALTLNAYGMVVMGGLMEFALCTNNQKKAFSWAESKVDLDGESRKEARATAKRRVEKVMN